MVSDATGLFFFFLFSLYAFIKSVLTLHDWKLPRLDVRNISIVLALQSQDSVRGKCTDFFSSSSFIPK